MVTATGIKSAVRDAALERVKRLDTKEVLGALRESGVNSLEELVQGILEHYRTVEPGSGPELAYDTFIYEQFIYKAAIALDLEQLVTTISRAEKIRAVER